MLGVKRYTEISRWGYIHLDINRCVQESNICTRKARCSQPGSTVFRRTGLGLIPCDLLHRGWPGRRDLVVTGYFNLLFLRF